VTPAEINSVSEGRDLDRLVAERVMGLEHLETLRGDDGYESLIYRFSPDSVCVTVPRFSTDMRAAWEMEEEIARRGEKMSHAYTVILTGDLWNDRGWDSWADSWALMRATPLQRCRAALKAALVCE
jgi:hypothetical protein